MLVTLPQCKHASTIVHTIHCFCKLSLVLASVGVGFIIFILDSDRWVNFYFHRTAGMNNNLIFTIFTINSVRYCANDKNYWGLLQLLLSP
jgi:hypothetical protein